MRFLPAMRISLLRSVLLPLRCTSLSVLPRLHSTMASVRLRICAKL